MLFNLAKNCISGGVIIEIGSWKGKSTVCLAAGSLSGPQITVYTIDIHTGSEEQRELYGKIWTYENLKSNIKKAGVSNIVKPIIGSSQQIAKKFTKPVGLLFIDGAHDYNSVRSDFKSWAPKLIPGGIIVFHDATNLNGPKKVVKKNIIYSLHYTKINMIASIVHAQKSDKKSLMNLFDNYYIFNKKFKRLK